MWEYFLLGYMASVFFSGAKHMTRRETDRQDEKWSRKLKNTNYNIESWHLQLIFLTFLSWIGDIYWCEIFSEREVARITQGQKTNLREADK